MTDTKIKELRVAYNDAEAASAAAYRVAYASDAGQHAAAYRVADDAERAAVAAWNAYQDAMGEKGGAK